MALVRSLSHRTIRVGSYYPEIFSKYLSQNMFDFHRSIGCMKANLKRECNKARTKSSCTVHARKIPRTTTNMSDVVNEETDQEEEVPEKGKILVFASSQTIQYSMFTFGRNNIDNE